MPRESKWIAGTIMFLLTLISSSSVFSLDQGHRFKNLLTNGLQGLGMALSSIEKQICYGWQKIIGN